MRFHLFEHTDAHIRKSLEYLEEAHLAWVEHKAAAEHHSALARMYSERITRIEAEIGNAHPSPMQTRQAAEELPDAASSATASASASASGRSKPESVVVYPSRATRL